MQLHTDEPERRFAEGRVIATEAVSGSGVPRELTIRSTRVHNGTWLLTFEEIPDRTGADKGLRGTLLVLDDETTPSDDDAFTADELVGLEARDPAGAVIGTVAGLKWVPRRIGSSSSSPMESRPTSRSSRQSSPRWRRTTSWSTPRPDYSTCTATPDRPRRSRFAP